MNLIEQYQSAVNKGLLQSDLEQQQVLYKLQSILDQLSLPVPWWQLWKRKIRGLYLHGHVGVGKTFLMNLFYRSVPESMRARYHFHHFMEYIHEQLRQVQGMKNPLNKIAADFAKQARVLCLDEFLVNDVGDASILALLLKALFREGVVLITTSNTAPENLYLNGINRARFLPAIALIQKHCEVYELAHHADYRLGKDTIAETYMTPLGKHTEAKFLEQFMKIEPHATVSGTLTIKHRDIPVVRWGKKAAWFEFNHLCQVPRCQLDYLEIAARFDFCFVSQVPRFKADESTAVLLFMYLVDVMYDERRHLILSAEVDLAELYVEGNLLTNFERTRSRLTEMQSRTYGFGVDAP